MKICSKCKQELTADKFNKCNSSKSNNTLIDYSSVLKPKKLKETLTYKIEDKIYKTNRLLYKKIVDYLDNDNPEFTEKEIIYLNNL